MKASRLFVLIFVVILISIAILLYNCEKQEELTIPFNVSVLTPNGEEVIRCWMNDQDDYFVFLPACSNLTDTQIHINISTEIYINGKNIQEGMCCDAFMMNTPYEIVFKGWSHTIVREIMFVKSGSVPTIFIDTKSQNIERLHSNKDYKEEATIRTYRCDGSLDYSGGLTSISGRGNATWLDYDKKPYGIETAEDVSLLNMGSARKWTLLANAGDPSNLRNKIGLDLAEQVGLDYSMESRWVDLYINGEYVGLYLLCEKIEVHPKRVAISGEGSFLISVELETRLKSQDITHVVTEAKQALRIHHPSMVSEAEQKEILIRWQSIENALLSEEGIDSQTGKSWLDLIDMDSWVKKYLLEEILGNWDACFISQFFYADAYKSDEKVYAGPAWDYDRTLGNTSWQFQYPNALYGQRLKVKGSQNTPWFYELYKKAEFYDRMVCIYEETFIPALNNLLNDTLAEYVEYIAAAHQMDQLRWGTNNHLLDEKEFIHEYISKRMAFLADIWIKSESYYFVHADPGFNQFYANIAVKSGECLANLRELSDSDTSKFLGWYYSGTDEPFDGTKPIYENITIYAKWQGIPSWWKNQLMEVVPGMMLAFILCILLAISVRRNKLKR